jgi:hypothetical protein
MRRAMYRRPQQNAVMQLLTQMQFAVQLQHTQVVMHAFNCVTAAPFALQLFEAVDGSSYLRSTTYTMLMGDNGRCVPAYYTQQLTETIQCLS